MKSLTPYLVAFWVVLGTALILISKISSSETFANGLLAAILFCFIFAAWPREYIGQTVNITSFKESLNQSDC